jgi:hypothetical protein
MSSLPLGTPCLRWQDNKAGVGGWVLQLIRVGVKDGADMQSSQFSKRFSLFLWRVRQSIVMTQSLNTCITSTRRTVRFKRRDFKRWTYRRVNFICLLRPYLCSLDWNVVTKIYGIVLVAFKNVSVCVERYGTILSCYRACLH